VRNFVKEDCKGIEPTEKAYHSQPKDKEKTNKESNCSKNTSTCKLIVKVEGLCVIYVLD
jgi:hypothetical protein